MSEEETVDKVISQQLEKYFYPYKHKTKQTAATLIHAFIVNSYMKVSNDSFSEQLKRYKNGDDETQLALEFSLLYLMLNVGMLVARGHTLEQALKESVASKPSSELYTCLTYLIEQHKPSELLAQPVKYFMPMLVTTYKNPQSVYPNLGANEANEPREKENLEYLNELMRYIEAYSQVTCMVVVDEILTGIIYTLMSDYQDTLDVKRLRLYANKYIPRYRLTAVNRIQEVIDTEVCKTKTKQQELNRLIRGLKTNKSKAKKLLNDINSPLLDQSVRLDNVGLDMSNKTVTDFRDIVLTLKNEILKDKVSCNNE